MTRIVYRPVPTEPDTLVVASARLRSYLGLSRDELYLHHVRPVRLDDPIAGDGVRRVGELTCDCNGGRFRGSCYWTQRAEAFEAGVPAAGDQAATWFDAAPGEFTEAFGK